MPRRCINPRTSRGGRVGSLREGSGIKRIHDECAVAGVKVEFNRLKTGFVVVFYRPKWEEGEGIEKGGQTGGQRSSEKGSEKSSERIIGEIRKNPSVSAQELAQTLGITSRAVEKQLSKLKEKGVIKRIGPDKGGHWEIVSINP